MNSKSSAITSLIWSNYNINFILLNMKLLALMHLITNYTTKDNWNKYQRVMVAGIIKKVFNKYDNNFKTNFLNYIFKLNLYA